MNYESFVDYIFKNVENKLTEDCKVTLEKVTKNNGKILDAIVIAKNDVCIAPTIYLNHLYHNYLFSIYTTKTPMVPVMKLVL